MRACCRSVRLVVWLTRMLNISRMLSTLLQVEMLSPTPIDCPISLYAPLCPQITPCGHVFSFPAIMQVCFTGTPCSYAPRSPGGHSLSGCALGLAWGPLIQTRVLLFV